MAPPSTPDPPHPGPGCRGQPGGPAQADEMYAKVAILADAKEELPKIPTGALLVEGGEELRLRRARSRRV